MKRKELINNAAIALLAQCVRLGLSLLTSLLVPKVLFGVEYGYWQLFLFYTAYVGFFHFGLDDGVYLLYGGARRDEIDKRVINSQFVVGTLLQIAIALVITLVCLLLAMDASRFYVMAWTAVYLVLINAAFFWGFVFQAINETRLFSVSTIVERVSFLVPLVVLLLLRCDDFRPYVIATVFAMCMQLAYSLYHSRDFLGSGLLNIAASVRETFNSMKVGISLTVANVASTLILGFSRFMIDSVWGIEQFGELSFVLSIVSFFLILASQASMVLFPALRQTNQTNLTTFFRTSSTLLGLFLPLLYLLYFPSVFLLEIWLPQFASTMFFFALLLPICVFDSKMDIVCMTYYKVTRQEKKILAINVVTMTGCAIACFLAAAVVRSIVLTVLAPVIAVVLRGLFADHAISKELNISHSRVWAGELFTTVCFIVIAKCVSGFLAPLIYLLVYSIFLAIFRKELARELASVR